MGPSSRVSKIKERTLRSHFSHTLKPLKHDGENRFSKSLEKDEYGYMEKILYGYMEKSQNIFKNIILNNEAASFNEIHLSV